MLKPTANPSGGGAMFRKVQHVHFVGIGGIGMSGIAEVLINQGFVVSGSDLRDTPVTRRLIRLGGQVYRGHKPDHVTGADVVVISSAVHDDNVEVLRARELQIPVIPRAEMLGELMRMKFSVAVAGTHGKTTTTSLASILLHHAGFDPTVVIGGRLNIFDSNARLGQGDFLVAEADESDGSFLKLFPSIAVVTNIDAEHMEFYGDMECLKSTFTTFVNRVPFYGSAVLCLDDTNIQSIIPDIERRFVTYGIAKNADIRATEVHPDGTGSRFRVVHGTRDLGEFAIRVPGRYNVLNALAVITVGLELAIPEADIRDALMLYQGVDRRFQTLGIPAGIRVVDDYGHHPTEIRATLEAARSLLPKRIVAVFQPHRYSRVQSLWDQFATSFYDADILFCTEIYPAGEQPVAEVTGQAMAAAIQAHGHKQVHFEPDQDRLAARLAALAEPGDLVITFGAGDIYRVGEQLVSILTKENDHDEK